MSNPIRANGKPKSSMQIDNAPTPHNTPASVLNNSYLKNGNPVTSQTIPQTIDEEDSNANAQQQVANALLAQKPLLLASIQDKLDDLIGTDSGYVESLPKDVKDRVYSLSSLQTELFDLEKNFQIEMFELEEKYNKLYRPLMERRYGITKGDIQPTKEEIIKGRELVGEEEEPEEEEEDEDEENIEGIPSFWLTALENLPIVSETITDRDAEVLEYLTDISMEYISEGQPGFQLIFKFDSDKNPFFKKEQLSKKYYYQSELGYSGDFVYDHAEGETIDWVSHEQNVTVNVEQKKQRNKNTKQVRTVERMTPVESFFNFFDPPVAPVEDEDKDEEEEEDIDEELESRLALDYSIGEQLKDKLIPRAIDWFTGAALEFEFVEDGEDEFEDGEEDEEEYDDDEGEDEEQADQDDFAGQEQAPECKQQ
ncbi:hypothetical protein C6P45_000182 [Maudiozyma exigua]|uniref:Nucleosome assembly protein n=1 Tax=Maudiozyma exigua TaxID=34358 RepID=A0A9P6W9Y3_MAUEX|nr:hypothetical protein C6P45_000182 [Kazachstania exigua]